MACEGCETKFFPLIQNFFNQDERALEEFQRHSVLPLALVCPTCGSKCQFRPSNRTFFCKKINRDSGGRRKVCKFSVTERKGTLLDKAHVKPSDLLLFISLFLSKARTQRDAEDWLGWASDTCVNWSSICYEVCEFWLSEQSCIGGPGKIVEVNESKFRKSKSDKSQDIEGKWVFGLLERDTKKLLLFPIEKRNSATLLPIVLQHVVSGTTIYSDKGCGYARLPQLGYDHHTVNRSDHLATADGIHTQSIKRSWREAKSWVLRSGNKVHMYPKYLARYLFARAYPKEQRLHQFLRFAGLLCKHPNSH